MCLKMFLIVLVAYLGTNCSHANPVGKVWKDYTYFSETDSFYKHHKTPTTWIDAQEICKSEEAMLFYPIDRNEAEIIVDWWKKLTGGGRSESFIHVGLIYSRDDGVLKTIDDLPIDQVYVDWRSGQPSSYDDLMIDNEENCVQMDQNLKFNDVKCDSSSSDDWSIMSFVCKKQLPSPNWNLDCDMDSKDYIFNALTGSCYSFHQQPMNWTDAEATCAAEQSYLAVINSQQEADYFSKLTENLPTAVRGVDKFLSGAVHLGFHNREGRGWRTVQGAKLKESGYARWGNYQPDGQGQEKCGSMFHNGHLNDINCDAECFFICEHDTEKQSNTYYECTNCEEKY